MTKTPSGTPSFDEVDEQFSKIGTVEYGRSKSRDHQRISAITDDPLIRDFNLSPKGVNGLWETNEIKTQEKLVTMKNQLSEIEAVAIISVLESMVDMLNILSYTNDKPRVEPTISYQTLDERFSDLIQSDFVDTNTKEYDPLSRYEILKKIQQERGALEVTLDSTIEDLKHLGHYKTLEEFVIHKTFANFEEEQLILQLKVNEEVAAEVKARITKEKYFLESMSCELEKKLAHIKDTMYDVSICNDIEKRYIGKWEKARGYQHQYALARQEKRLKERVLDVRRGVDFEINANYQVLSFLSLDIDQLSLDVKTWNEKAFEDLDEIELKTQKKKTQLELIVIDVGDAAAILKERHFKIVSTLVRRVLPLRFRILHQRREKAATTIQKWWRAKLKEMKKRKWLEALGISGTKRKIRKDKQRGVLKKEKTI